MSLSSEAKLEARSGAYDFENNIKTMSRRMILSINLYQRKFIIMAMIQNIVFYSLPATIIFLKP